MVLILITFQKMDEATLFLKIEHEHFVHDNKSWQIWLSQTDKKLLVYWLRDIVLKSNIWLHYK